jgi:hypothetical protein
MIYKARAPAEVEDLEGAAAVPVVEGFVNKLAAYEAVDAVYGADAGGRLWPRALAEWHDGGGCLLSVEALQTLYARSPSGLQAAKVASA